MYLMYQKAGRRFKFSVSYDNQTGALLNASYNHKNLKNKVQTEAPKDIEGLCSRNLHKLFLMGGVTRIISKDCFIDQLEGMPLISNLLRVETFYRDRG